MRKSTRGGAVRGHGFGVFETVEKGKHRARELNLPRFARPPSWRIEGD